MRVVTTDEVELDVEAVVVAEDSPSVRSMTS